MPDRAASATRAGIAPAGGGRTWQELPVGWATRTLARTVTEFDLMAFVTLAGYAEPLFYDARDQTFAGERRLVPGALTFALAEGLVIQSRMILGTGIAFLGTRLDARAPVFVGDTIDVEVEVTESRATSRPDRGIVVTRNRVFNQDDRLVLEYCPERMIAGRDGG